MSVYWNNYWTHIWLVLKDLFHFIGVYYWLFSLNIFLICDSDWRESLCRIYQNRFTECSNASIKRKLGCFGSNVWGKQKKKQNQNLTAIVQWRNSWHRYNRAGKKSLRSPVHSGPLQAVCAGWRLLLVLRVVLLCFRWSLIPTPPQDPPVGSISSIPLLGGGGGGLLFIPWNVWADYHHGMNTCLMPNLLLCRCCANFDNNSHFVMFIQVPLTKGLGWDTLKLCCSPWTRFSFTKRTFLNS